MNPWIQRAIVVILSVAFVPLIVTGISALTMRGVKAVSQGVESLIGPLSMTGDPRMQGLIELCLYLVAIVYIGKFLSRIR